MIDTRIDPRSLKLVEDALNAANRKTKWAVGVAESKAMHFICRSGAAAVKPKSMRAKREIVPNPGRMGIGRRAKGAKYAVKVLRQQGAPTYIPTNVKSGNPFVDKVRQIKKLGLAARAFKLGGAAFQARIRGEKFRSRTNLVDASQFGMGDKINSRIEIFLTYIEKHAPSAINTAITKGMAQFVRAFDRDWATAIKESGLAA